MSWMPDVMVTSPVPGEGLVFPGVAVPPAIQKESTLPASPSTTAPPVPAAPSNSHQPWGRPWRLPSTPAEVR